MARQCALFDVPPAKRRVMMHVVDAGCGDDMPHRATFACDRCGKVTEWMQIRTAREMRSGLPCPTCNKQAET